MLAFAHFNVHPLNEREAREFRINIGRPVALTNVIPYDIECGLKTRADIIRDMLRILRRGARAVAMCDLKQAGIEGADQYDPRPPKRIKA